MQDIDSYSILNGYIRHKDTKHSIFLYSKESRHLLSSTEYSVPDQHLMHQFCPLHIWSK